MAESDTIFALATPPGRSALAVFRISGRRAGEVLKSLTARVLPVPRVVVRRGIRDPGTGSKIDEALATYFKGPASFTGEDVVELSVHGGRGVISALSSALMNIPGVRAAEPGEFTRRAYRAGKFDLSQAEAIADLIDSETEFQRRQALRLLEGGVGRKADEWRGILLEIAVEIESMLDFSDEGDVGAANCQSLIARAERLRGEMTREEEAGRRSLTLRNGFTVVIAGAPNAGKSTLFNRLAGSELAIVTEHAGTTRDLISVDLDLDGIPIKLVDTAGMRIAVDPVESIGIERAHAAVASADLVIRLVTDDHKEVGNTRVTQDLVVWSKADLFAPPPGSLAISVFDSDSISNLVAIIREKASRVVGDGSEGLLIRERHVRALAVARECLSRFVEMCETERFELAAEECRVVNEALGAMSGAYETEELLGEIFARFCIGK